MFKVVRNTVVVSQTAGKYAVSRSDFKFLEVRKRRIKIL